MSSANRFYLMTNASGEMNGPLTRNEQTAAEWREQGVRVLTLVEESSLPSEPVACSECGGDGYTVEPECCGRPGDECCGCPEPQMVPCSLKCSEKEEAPHMSATAFREVIEWALGERGEFPDRPERVEGKPYPFYWWRSEMRKRYEAALGATDGGRDG